MTPPPEPPTRDPRVRAVEQLVSQALEHYGSEAAKVSVTWGPEAEAWFVAVEPRRQGAARLSIG